MEKKWWHNKIAYQIYPKSFYDANGDGIGDLKGIIEKLDYLSELGIEILWISPIYASPFIDEGYDISDYYAIDPVFGTMEDMDILIVEAKKRGIYVLMDLVVNHCSSQHQWFKEAIKNPDGPYGDYFYIMKGKEGKPPTNWRSYFGGSVWEAIPGTDKYYLHLFAKEQPDLNWENPKLRDEIYKMMNWWLDKGIAGFRIDAIINIKKDRHFRSFTPDGPDGLCSYQRMLENASGILDFLFEMKERTFDPHKAFTIAELFNYDKAALKAYIGEKGCFSSIFDFSMALEGVSDKGWYDNERVTPEVYENVIIESQTLTSKVGFLGIILENHDEPRAVSRYLEDPSNLAGQKLLAMLQFIQKGIPFIYQGQEIGMTNTLIDKIEDVDDISTIDEYEKALKAGLSEKEALKAVALYSRDNARTPFQWSSDVYAGFSDAKPWMKVNPNYRQINLDEQKKDEQSLFNFYKELISLRKDHRYEEAFVYGALAFEYEELVNVIGIHRWTQACNLFCVANFQPIEMTLEFGHKEVKKILLNNLGNVEIRAGKAFMLPYQCVLLELK